MARVIDLTKPLNAEDRKYLQDRCRWKDIATADALESPQEAVQKAEEELTPDGSRAAPTVVVGGAPVSPAAGDDPLADKPYSEWPYAALQEELKARQQEAIDAGVPVEEARETYKAGGKAPELVARLEADDKRVEAESQQ
jgi:hypothetical protein